MTESPRGGVIRDWQAKKKHRVSDVGSEVSGDLRSHMVQSDFG